MKKFIILSILVTSGCSWVPKTPNIPLSARSAETTLEERALISNLASAYIPADSYECPIDKSENCEIKANKSFKYRNLSSQEIRSFVDAGMTLSDLYCDKFFKSINQASRKRQFARGAFNDAGGAIAAVLGLVKAGSAVTGGTAAGFSFIDSGFRNYDESFLVDTNISMMRRLVISAQDNMKKKIIASPPSNIFRAESTVIRYSGLCSFLGMQDLLNSSLQAQINKTEDNTRNIAKENQKPFANNVPPPPPN